MIREAIDTLFNNKLKTNYSAVQEMNETEFEVLTFLLHLSLVEKPEVHEWQEWWKKLTEGQKNNIRNIFNIKVTKATFKKSFSMLWESNFTVGEEVDIPEGKFRIRQTGNNLYPRGKHAQCGSRPSS